MEKIPPKGFVNYHAVPLPEYKGWAKKL